MKRWIVLLALYALIAALTFLGVIGADYSLQQDGFEKQPPGAHGVLGTDDLGRDVLSQTLQGSWIAFGVGALAAAIATAIGLAFGMAAGWYGGRVDAVAVWVSGVVAAVPGILLLLAMTAVMGTGVGYVIVAIGLASWIGVFRVVRAEVLRYRTTDYVLASRAAGAPAHRLMVRHVLPQLSPLLMVQFGLLFVFAIKAEIILSFLGVGITAEPSWGRMMANAQGDLRAGMWWPLVAATAATFGLVLAVQGLVDHLRDRFDPTVGPRA